MNCTDLSFGLKRWNELKRRVCVLSCRQFWETMMIHKRIEDKQRDWTNVWHEESDKILCLKVKINVFCHQSIRYWTCQTKNHQSLYLFIKHWLNFNINLLFHSFFIYRYNYYTWFKLLLCRTYECDNVSHTLSFIDSHRKK